MSKHEVSHFRFSLLLREIDSMRVTEGVSTVAMALIQLDGMDEVNERFGYLGGDKVLKEFAVRLAGVVGHRGRTFEIGGRSFALLIQNPLHEGDAVSGAEKIAKAASDPVSIGTGKARVHARMGISLLPDPALTAEELLRQCEIALAKARSNGETYRIFTPNLAEPDGYATKSWFDVETAIKQGEFELHYQPSIDLRSGTLTGTEALIRWQSPRAGTIPPGYFLPDITSLEGVRTMLQYVLDVSLKSAAKWIDAIPGFRLAVNLAPKSVTDPELVGVVSELLEKWNFPADRLTLEVSEESLHDNLDAAIVQFGKLHNRGVRIAIDDFGVGHLGIADLKRLPVDQLKIDKSFVVPIPSNEKDRRLVGALIQLAHALDLEVVAEGIEDADIMQTLLAIGCEKGEGYHFSRPIPEADFARQWIEKFSRSPAVSA
jgi:diguanylate cyclase (GGDEF)-like protein